MTATEAKNKLVAWLTAQLGYCEGSNNWNKYAKGKYAAYGWDVQNQPWCDVFADAAYIECFGLDNASKMTYQPKGNFSALCSASANYYRENKAWFTQPEVGDQAFFIVGNGINHTGIVTAVRDGSVTTVEGNSSDSVQRNVYSISSSYIAGYGRPDWTVVSDGNTEPSAPKPATEKTCMVAAKVPVLQNGDTGHWVKIMQLRLLAKGYKLPRWGADGDFGKETQNAVERFQKDTGLVVDSVVGQTTWAKLIGE